MEVVIKQCENKTKSEKENKRNNIDQSSINVNAVETNLENSIISLYSEISNENVKEVTQNNTKIEYKIKQNYIPVFTQNKNDVSKLDVLLFVKIERGC